MANDTELCVEEVENIDTQFEQAFMKMTSICAPFTIIFNGLVLYIAFRFIDLRSKVNQFFVVSMTFADFMYGINYMATRAILESLPWWLCRPYYVITWVCQIASVMFLLFLNVDKFVSLTVPLRYHVIVTERKVIIQSGVCWAVIMAYAVVSAFEPLLVITPVNCVQCIVSIHPQNYAFMIFMCYICPIVISLIISIYIFVLAQHKTRFVPDFPDSQINRRERKRLLKRIFFVFSSTIWTAVTSLPYRLGTCIVWLCMRFEMDSGRDSVHDDTLNFTLSSSTLLNFTTTASSHFTTSSSHFTTGSSHFTPSFNFTSNVTMVDDSISAYHKCRPLITSILVWCFAYFMQLGTVGNPLITIITQRAYRQRALFLWSVFLKRVHGPKICLPLSYMSVRRKSKSEDESTKVVDVNEDVISSYMIVSPQHKRSSKQNAFELM